MWMASNHWAGSSGADQAGVIFLNLVYEKQKQPR
jgi:hypothetical protein